MDDVFD
jgi:essential nuclear protein 1